MFDEYEGIGMEKPEVELSYEVTWLDKYKKEGFSNSDLYAVATYWTVQTITTVGYGDIGGVNNMEKLFQSFAMIIGVLFFTFANSSLTSIIQNIDSS